jgi:hypothetical protein
MVDEGMKVRIPVMLLWAALSGLVIAVWDASNDWNALKARVSALEQAQQWRLQHYTASHSK